MEQAPISVDQNMSTHDEEEGYQLTRERVTGLLETSSSYIKSLMTAGIWRGWRFRPGLCTANLSNFSERLGYYLRLKLVLRNWPHLLFPEAGVMMGGVLVGVTQVCVCVWGNVRG